MVAQFNDNRRHDPRVDNNIPIKIFQEDGDLVTETGNISRSGAYCKVSKYIAPMTKLRVNLLIPFRKNDKITTKKVSCEGVVVRTDAIPGKDQYNIAIFFQDITQRDADCIADYVSIHLENPN